MAPPSLFVIWGTQISRGFPFLRHCERSEAIQKAAGAGLDCFVGFASSQ